MRFQPVLQAGHRVLNVHVYEGRAKRTRFKRGTRRRSDGATARRRRWVSKQVVGARRIICPRIRMHRYEVCARYMQDRPKNTAMCAYCKMCNSMPEIASTANVLEQRQQQQNNKKNRAGRLNTLTFLRPAGSSRLSSTTGAWYKMMPAALHASCGRGTL